MMHHSKAFIVLLLALAAVSSAQSARVLQGSAWSYSKSSAWSKSGGGDGAKAETGGYTETNVGATGNGVAVGTATADAAASDVDEDGNVAISRTSLVSSGVESPEESSATTGGVFITETYGEAAEADAGGSALSAAYDENDCWDCEVVGDPSAVAATIGFAESLTTRLGTLTASNVINLANADQNVLDAPSKTSEASASGIATATALLGSLFG